METRLRTDKTLLNILITKRAFLEYWATIILILAPFFLNAQEHTFETLIDYQLESEYVSSPGYTGTLGRFGYPPSYMEAIKTDILAIDADPNRVLIQSIWDHLLKGNLAAYDLESNQQLSIEEIKKATEITNQNTYQRDFEEIIQTVTQDYFPHINSFKIKQVWGIRDTQMHIRVVEVIPILFYRDRDENIVQKELFSIQFPDKLLTSTNLLNQSNHTFIKYSKDYFSFDSLQLNQTDRLAFKSILWDRPIQEQISTYSNEYDILHPQTALDQILIKEIIRERIDTIITFHPETYDESMTIERRKKLEYDDIIGFKLNTIWIWDEKSIQLYSIPIGIAPIVDVQQRYVEPPYKIKLKTIR